MSGSRWRGGHASAVWVFGAVLLILLATLPPQPHWAGVRQPFLRSLLPGNVRWGDVGQNVALYVPLGLVFAARGVSSLGVGAAAAALSLLTEVLQYSIPGRNPAARDVIVNTVGAAIGYAAGRWSPLRGPAVGVLYSIQQWLGRARNPGPRRASMLLLVWAGCIAVIVTLTAALLIPAPPPGEDFFFIASPVLDRTRGPLRIGSSGWPRGFFKGTIDEVRIYNRARTEDEIRDEMLRPAAEIASHPHLVAAYGFDSNGDAVAHDETGHGHDGAVRHASWTEQGRLGGALAFDGVRSEVVVPRSPLFDLVDGMTLEAWILASGDSPAEGSVISQAGDVYYLRESADLAPLRAAGGGRFGTVPRHAQLAEPLSAGKWTHLAATYDGQSIRLYVDGRLGATRVHWSPHRNARASLSGVELLPGRVANAETFRASFFGDVALEVVLTCGPIDDTPAPVFLVAGLQSSEVLALIARGEDLFIKPLTQAGRLGLASPATRVRDALRGCDPGHPLPLRVSGRLQNPRISRGDQTLDAETPSVGSAWAFLIHVHLLPAWVQRGGTLAWLALLAIPVGLWVRRTAVAAAGLVVIVIALLYSPSFFHVRRLDAYESASLLAGSAVGAIYRRTTRGCSD